MSEKIDKPDTTKIYKKQNYNQQSYSYSAYDDSTNSGIPYESYFIGNNTNLDISKKFPFPLFYDETNHQQKTHANYNHLSSQSFNIAANNYDSTHNLINARQRIQQKAFNNPLSKTVSAPYNPN